MTPAHVRWPQSRSLDWLTAMDAWSERTGTDLGTLGDHELPCARCDGIIDRRDFANVLAHEHDLEPPEGGWPSMPGGPVLAHEDVA